MLAAGDLFCCSRSRLGGQAEKLAALARALPPPERAEIARAVRRTSSRRRPSSVDFALVPEFEAAAPEALRAGAQGRESVSLATLVIQWSDPELFRSARAELTDGFEPLIASIGQVIAAKTRS